MRPQRRQPLRRAASALSATALAVGLLGASSTISTAQSVMPDLGAPDQSQPAQPAQPGTDVQALPPIGPDTTVPPAPMPADATPPATFGRSAVPTDQDQSHWDHRPSADRPQVAKSGRQWHPTEKPNRTITPGQMRSDREQLPEGFTKADADKAETMEAQLGTPTTDGGTFRAAAAPGCQVYWPAPYEVCGAIRDKYNALGGPSSFLLFPKTNELTNPDGKGKRTEFQNGPIYWSAQGGAHPVVNHFLAAWARRGYEAGVIGYPTTDEIVNPDGIGRRQHFTGSTIYWKLNEAYSIGGAIADKWYGLNAERVDSQLGYPTSDELVLPDGVGRMNRFERGVIYWHPNTGAHFIGGTLLNQWSSQGYEKGALGYPITDPVLYSTDIFRQYFQYGVLYGSQDNKQYYVERAHWSSDAFRKWYNCLDYEIAPAEGIAEWIVFSPSARHRTVTLRCERFRNHIVSAPSPDLGHFSVVPPPVKDLEDFYDCVHRVLNGQDLDKSTSPLEYGRQYSNEVAPGVWMPAGATVFKETGDLSSAWAGYDSPGRDWGGCAH